MNPEQNEPNKLIHSDDASRIPVSHNTAVVQEAIAHRQPDEDIRVGILDYWRVVVKRKWIILTITLVVIVVVGIKTWKQTPMYSATAKLQIDVEQSNILPYKDAFQETGSGSYLEYLQTQIKTIQSATLASRVIRALKLEANPKFLGEARPSLMTWFAAWVASRFDSAVKKGESPLESDRGAGITKDVGYSPLAGSVLANLSVVPVRGSRLVEVSFICRDAALAATIVNTICSEYIEYNFEAKVSATQSATKFLSKQLVDLQSKVEKSEEALIRFGRERGIVTLQDQGSEVNRRLFDLTVALTQLQIDRMQKESAWHLLQETLPDIPETLRSADMVALESRLNALRQDEASLSVQYKPGWPELDRIRSQREELERQLAQSKQKAIKAIENDYQMAMRRESLAVEALAAQKTEATTLNQNSIQFNILKQEVESNRQLYDGFLQRLKEAGVSAGLKSSNIRVLDEAGIPGAPYTPDKRRNLLFALLAGLGIGIGLAFFLEYLDNSVKTPEDVDRFIKLPSLGVIPSLSSLLPAQSRSRLTESAGVTNGSGNSSSVELVTHHHAESMLSEAYRNLRTSVLLSSAVGRPPKSLLFTSSQIGEGKTTTALNIAITLAQTGRKVIVLDCDMRHPRLHRFLNLDRAAGMSAFLSGNSELSSIIQQTAIPNLFAVPSGRFPPNPAELVGSERMKQAVAFLDQHFDHIVMDSPPLLLVADARILASTVDGVILVIKAGKTSKQAVQQSKRLLQQVHAHTLGTLLNDADIFSPDYYYYSKSYYYGSRKKYHYVYAEKPPDVS
jgi:capsular exopolysaccharide synthesis family protein